MTEKNDATQGAHFSSYSRNEWSLTSAFTFAAVSLTWSGNQVLLVVAAMALVACNVGVRRVMSFVVCLA